MNSCWRSQLPRLLFSLAWSRAFFLPCACHCSASSTTATARTLRCSKRLGDGIWHLNPVVPGAVTEPGRSPLQVRRAALLCQCQPFFRRNANAGEHRAFTVALVDRGCRGHHARGLHCGACCVRTTERPRRSGHGLVFAHVQSDLKPDLDRHHLTEVIGANRIFDSLHEALAALHKTRPG